MRRFTRLTNAFSKKVENHAHAVALHMMYYNFVRIHKTLKVTPAMAAGVTDKLWEMGDIVAVLYQLALVTTYARGCRGFATPVQALDSTRIYDAITPHNIRDMSQDFRVWVLEAWEQISKSA
jgi:hypothetical protein